MRHLIDLWLDNRGGMVTGIAKAAGLIGLLSVVAANLVSTQVADLDTDRMTRIASAASKGQPIDPLVTGSIRSRANEMKLDPCALPR